MKQVLTTLMLALSLASSAHAVQTPPQYTPVVCVTDGCSDPQIDGPRR